MSIRNFIQEVIKDSAEYKRLKNNGNFLAIQCMIDWYVREFKIAEETGRLIRDRARFVNQNEQPKNMRNVAEVPYIYLAKYAHMMGKEPEYLTQDEMKKFLKTHKQFWTVDRL